MTVARATKLQRARMQQTHIPELDYPYCAGWVVVAAVNGLLWTAILHGLGAF